MPGSQLTQLRSALSASGLNRKSTSKKDRKSFKKGGARETDREKTLARLEGIRKSLNKFDEVETKLKHDVGGRQLKGVTGRPTSSKQAGLEERRKKLLPEHQLKGHRGTFRDRRFGESDPSMSLEDRELERYARERQRGQGRKGMFNLEDDGDEFGAKDGFATLGTLTHGGRSVMNLPGDDFEAQGFGETEDEDHVQGGKRRLDGTELPRRNEDDPDVPEVEEEERRKSKAEVMSEIIAKSKGHKLERQEQREMDEDIRQELDDGIDDLRTLLRPNVPAEAGPSRRPAVTVTMDADYDQDVRSLAFDARSKPKNRTKTEEELAAEEAETLQKAEARRLRRMRGESISDEDDEDPKRPGRRKESRREADDLDDDFEEEPEDGPFGRGLTREDIENMAPITGPGMDSDLDEAEGEGDGESEEDDDSGSEDEEEDDSDDSEEAAVELESDEESAVQDSLPGGEVMPLTSSKRRTKQQKQQEHETIPYTFPCPASIDELEEILDTLPESALDTVIQRIRALHHPSLAQGNKEKLQNFLGVLIDHFFILTSQKEPDVKSIRTLTPHMIALIKLNPITAAKHFLEKLAIMQKNLVIGLSRAAADDAKTFPGVSELLFLRLTGAVWSTSDFRHPVIAPALLLMAQYLGQCRIRNVADLASGLFLCSLVLEFEAFSKRLVPEAVNFLRASLELFSGSPRGAMNQDSHLVCPVRLQKKVETFESRPVDLVTYLTVNSTRQAPPGLAAIVLSLVDALSVAYVASPAFVELFIPILRSLQTQIVKGSLKDKQLATRSSLQRAINLAKTSREPLALQSHKPIPIASYAPRFEDDFTPDRHYDHDVDRNAAKKLKNLYNKEKRGAINELRKDNRFLAGEKARQQRAKDEEYAGKMRRIEGEITLERAEEKQMQREKAREKRRAGRR